MAHRHKRLLMLANCILILIMIGVAEAGPMPMMAGDSALAPTKVTLNKQIDLALVGGMLIDGRGGAPIKDAIVMIRGDRIVAVGQAGTLRVPAGTPTRNLHGKTILPGFINAHVHISKIPDLALKGWTRVGITTVRDLAGAPKVLLARRRALTASNDAAYPRLLVAGPFITVPGGHPIPRNGLSDEVVTVQGAQDARTKVTALLDSGVDLIKIVVSGRTDVHWPELSNAEIAAITTTAHARGVRVTAHVDRASALRRAVENGIDDAAHMPRDRMPDELIALMVKRKVALVPTINVYEDLAQSRGLGVDWHRWTLPIMQDNLRRFAAAGGTLALGDDYGGIEGMALEMPMAEIDYWLGADLTPMQILVAATSGSALVSDLASEIGQVRPGMLADLLIVDGNPLQNMAALTRPALVVHSGVIVMP
jgi:imidazolonepropionase-like amidohydrolase